MPVRTITWQSDDDRKKNEFPKTIVSDPVDLEPDTLYATGLFQLAAAVSSDDYAALKTAIEAIPGIQEVTLLVDGRTKAAADLPADHTQMFRIKGILDLRDDTP